MIRLRRKTSSRKNPSRFRQLNFAKSGLPLYRPARMEVLEPRIDVASISSWSAISGIGLGIFADPNESVTVGSTAGLVTVSDQNGSINFGSVAASQVVAIDIWGPNRTSGSIDLTGVSSSVFTNLSAVSVFSDGSGLVVNGGDGDTWLFGGWGTNILNGGHGANYLYAAPPGIWATNILNGGDGLNILSGGYGTNILNAGGGANTLYGSFGTNILNGSAGVNTLLGGSGTNVLNGDGGVNYLTAGVFSLAGTAQWDTNTLNANGGTNYLIGDAGSNVLNGNGGGQNVLSGGAGSNTLDGYGGSDNLLYGGTGSNTLYGGAGTNDLYGGGAGSDNMLYGGAGANTLHDGGGYNVLYGGHGSGAGSGSGSGAGSGSNSGATSSVNIIYGTTGDNTLYDGGGINTLYAGSGANNLVGTGGGYNVLSMASGELTLTGTPSGYSLANSTSGPQTLDINADGAGNVTFGLAANVTYQGPSGPLNVNNGNNLNLVKDGAGNQVIGGLFDSYNGPTTINAGTLTLANSTWLAGTAITVESGATFAAGSGFGNSAFSGHIPSLALNPGSNFTVAGGGNEWLFFNGQSGSAAAPLAINNATLNLELTASGSDHVIDYGAASVSGANTINITPLGTSLTPGTYTLFSAASGLTGDFVFANGSTQESIFAGGQYFSLTLNNTDTAETVSVAYTSPTFSWPNAPDDNALVIPDDSTQPQPPTAPTYTGDAFDYTQDTGYQATSSSADNTLSSQIATANQTYTNSVETAATTQGNNNQTALSNFISQSSTAWDTYNNTISGEQQPTAGSTTDVDDYNNYLGTRGQDKAGHDSTTGAALSTEQAAITTINSQEQAEIADAATQYGAGTAADRQAVDAIIQNYATDKFQPVLDTYQTTVLDAARDQQTKDAAAYLIWQTAFDKFTRDQNKQYPNQSLANFNTTLGAEEQYAEDVAAAAETYAEAESNNAQKYAYDVADAARTRDQTIADDQYAHDTRVAQAELDAYTSWANTVASTDSDPNDVAWANYQVALAGNENHYQQQVAGLAKTQAYANAQDAWTEAYAAADAVQQQAINDAKADQTRTGQIATVLQTLESGIKAAETSRDFGSSEADAIESLDDAWCDYQIAQATAYVGMQTSEASTTDQYETLTQKAIDAATALSSACGIATSSGSVAAADFTTQQADANSAKQTAIDYDPVQETIADDEAVRKQNDALATAQDAYEHAVNAASANASETVSGLYATYETSLGRAQDAYNATVAGDARDEAVRQAQAEAGQMYRDAEADANFTGGDGTSSNPGEAALSDAQNIADAQAKFNFETGEANAYQQAVQSWATGQGRWGQYQLALANDAVAQVTTTDNAAVTEAQKLATDDAASTQSTVADQLTYAQTMYGGEIGGGAYVTRAQQIANGESAAATQ